MENSNTQVVLLSPVHEDQKALSTRIEETVQMSSYQIKKALMAERDLAMKTYKDLEEEERALGTAVWLVTNRVQHLMKDNLATEATTLLTHMQPYFSVGEEGTYFHDNRSTTVDLYEIAQAITHAEDKIYYSVKNLVDELKVSIYGSINIFSFITDNFDHNDYKNCVTLPQRINRYFDITAEEAACLIAHAEIAGKKKAENLKVNDLDLKLKNIGELTDDIRYAMLVEKNRANGDDTVSTIATKIADAYIQGIDPSVALLK